MIQDWYHTPVFELWFQERQTPPIPGDNGLINGKNMYNGQGEYSEFKFKKGKKYRMRIINSSTDQHFRFTIDGHEMVVQAADFIAIEPYTQTVLNIAIGIFPPRASTTALGE
jgi:FtsP/CotA-like multicopper oxidase with cupredoxin domain